MGGRWLKAWVELKESADGFRSLGLMREGKRTEICDAGGDSTPDGRAAFNNARWNAANIRVCASKRLREGMSCTDENPAHKFKHDGARFCAR